MLAAGPVSTSSFYLSSLEEQQITGKARLSGRVSPGRSRVICAEMSLSRAPLKDGASKSWAAQCQMNRCGSFRNLSRELWAKNGCWGSAEVSPGLEATGLRPVPLTATAWASPAVETWREQRPGHHPTSEPPLCGPSGSASTCEPCPLPPVVGGVLWGTCEHLGAWPHR